MKDPREGYLSSDHAYATYAGMISRLDRQVGEVLALLDELNLAENTLVIFTSDNGAQGNTWAPLIDFFKGTGPLRGNKGQLYEGGIRVPLIARWPGKIEPGSVVDHVTYFPDVMPTLAEVAGVKAPPGIDGISFLPTLLGRGNQKEHAHLYWAHYQGHNESPQQQAVRMGNWKAVQPEPDTAVELYDLASDIGESRNLAAQKPEMVEKLTKLMDQSLFERRVYAETPITTRADFVR